MSARATAMHGDVFAARIVGDSMTPRAPDGTICLFRIGVPHSLDGALVLIEIDTSLGGGRYMLKRLRAEAPRPNRPRAFRVESINPETPRSTSCSPTTATRASSPSLSRPCTNSATPRSLGPARGFITCDDRAHHT